MMAHSPVVKTMIHFRDQMENTRNLLQEEGSDCVQLSTTGGISSLFL